MDPFNVDPTTILFIRGASLALAGSHYFWTGTPPPINKVGLINMGLT